MKKNILCILIFLLDVFIPCISDAGSIIGLYKITIKEGRNLISIPMQTVQLSQGQITIIISNTITDDTKSWTEDEYENDILVIATGTGEGYYYRIISNTRDTLTLAEPLSTSISMDDYFYIYKAYTLEELFGDASGPLDVGDVIYLWDRQTQTFSEPIYLLDDGWYQGGSRITDNSITLIPNEACYIYRNTASDTTINYLGDVPKTKQVLVIKTGNNILGESYPTAVTMIDSDLNTVLRSGYSPDTADNIHQWNYDEQDFDIAIWHSNYPGYAHWYQGDEIADYVTLEPAEGFEIINIDSEEKHWQRDKPYTEP